MVVIWRWFDVSLLSADNICPVAWHFQFPCEGTSAFQLSISWVLSASCLSSQIATLHMQRMIYTRIFCRLLDLSCSGCAPHSWQYSSSYSSVFDSFWVCVEIGYRRLANLKEQEFALHLWPGLKSYQSSAEIDMFWVSLKHKTWVPLITQNQRHFILETPFSLGT